MQVVSIALALDENYAPHTAAVIASIFENSKERNINIFLLTDNLGDSSKERLISLVKGYGGNLYIIEGNAEEFYTSAHLSKAAYLRLKIPELLPQNISRVIYLDADLLLKSDVSELFNIDLNNKPLGAVIDLGIMTSVRSMREKCETFGFKVERYFNSGVLLMDLTKWRENDYTNQLLNLVKTHNYRHHDQDALNILFYSDWHEIPLEFNIIPPVFEMPFKVLFSSYRKAAAQALNNVKIIHYAGGHKPWHYNKTLMLNDYYYEMLAKTPFAVNVENERTFRKFRELFRILWGRFFSNL